MASADYQSQSSEQDKVHHQTKLELAVLETSLSPANPVAVKKLLQKCDVHVIPPLFLIYLLAFLDRTNIGNARIQGLEASLHMKDNDFNIALCIFFLPYILLEVPSNIIIKRVAPSTWLSGIVILWGIATVGQGVVKSYGGFVACRFLIGMFEAGLGPGCIYLISMYYERYQLQWRLTLFSTGSIIAGGIGGLLAYALSHMADLGGYEGWRWIFIIEGLAIVVVGVISKFWIVEWPETAKFLSDEERALLTKLLSDDSGQAQMNKLDKRAARRIFFDWKIYCGTLMYMGVITTGYSTSFFIPTILKQMGYTAAMSQILTVPIFACATVVAVGVAFATDRLRHRFLFVILGVVVSAVGYAIMLNMKSVHVGVRYLACYLIVTGCYIAQPVTLVWLSNQMGGHYKRSMAVAIQIGLGNCGGIVASNVFLSNQAPTYKTGFATCISFLIVLGGGSAIAMFLGLKAENRKRDHGGRNYRLTEEVADLDNMGDDHPDFRFTL